MIGPYEDEIDYQAAIYRGQYKNRKKFGLGKVVSFLLSLAIEFLLFKDDPNPK